MFAKIMKWFYKDRFCMADLFALGIFSTLINKVGWDNWWTLSVVGFLFIAAAVIEYTKKYWQD